jgi:selenocysteine lyase/cysteine desulfurase
VDRIREHSARLIAKLRREIKYPLMTPEDARGPIITFALKDPAMVAERLRKAKVDVSISGNRMRVSPSVYNDEHDVDRLVEALG